MLQMKSTDERIVAVLHDVVEDTHWKFETLRAEGYSEDIIGALDSVTRRPGESYDDYVDRAGANSIGRQVKLADLRDNATLSRIANPTEKDRKRVEKYLRAIARLSPAPNVTS